MPTNANAYNSRLTDESLEKRFRDTFRSQGGAELVDDLYASGVIVPVVDFTAAAEGDSLPQYLQRAWDSATGFSKVSNATTTFISNAGFWQIDLTATIIDNAATAQDMTIQLNTGIGFKDIWQATTGGQGTDAQYIALESSFIVFVNSGASIRAVSPSVRQIFNIWYRQVATVNGDLKNPDGFTSS